MACAAPAARPAAALRQILREATAPSHALLDERFASLADGELAAYHAFVRMNAACHGVLEPWLATVLPAEVRAKRRDFRCLLEADMAAMSLAPLPAPRFAPNAPAIGAAAGVLYVLDGSRLGARVIARNFVSAQPDAGNATPAHYLSGSIDPGPVFAAFDLLAASLGQAEIESSVDGARASFDMFLAMSELATDR